jgi:hypothetical protein
MRRSDVRTYAGGLIRYDRGRRRVWLANQRLHHGLTGALLATGGMAGIAAKRLTRRGGVEWAVLGMALMAHDWHDRGHWFERGDQSALSAMPGPPRTRR